MEMELLGILARLHRRSIEEMLQAVAKRRLSLG
jgi:hypothetical protein